MRIGTYCRNEKKAPGRLVEAERDVNNCAPPCTQCTAADAVRKRVLGFSRARLTLGEISAQYSPDTWAPYLVRRFRRFPSHPPIGTGGGRLFAETGPSCAMPALH